MGVSIERYLDWLTNEVPHQDGCGWEDPRKSTFVPECSCLARRVIERLDNIGELDGSLHTGDIELPDGF